MNTTTMTAAPDALAPLSAENRDSIPEQAASQDTSTAPVIGRDPYPLSFDGLAISSGMRALLDRYTAAFLCDDDGNDGDVSARLMYEAACDLAIFSPRTPADTAAKLMLGLHYLHPNKTGGALAIDTEHFDSSAAGEVLISSMNELVTSAAMARMVAAKPSTGAWNTALLAHERADAAMEATPPDPSEQFDPVACVEFARRMDLLLTPAPTVAELAHKLALYIRTDGRHLVRADEVARAMEADARRLASISEGASDDEWTKALSAFDALSTALKARGLTDEQVDELAPQELDASRAVVALPARSIADVATKLRIQMKLAVMIEHDGLTEILADLDRLQRETVKIGTENPALVDAFATFRDAFGKLKAEAPDTSDKVVENYYYRRMDPADVLLKAVPAVTPTGVLMKLKRAFVGIIGEAWSDHAVFDDRPASFAKGVETSDLYQEMLWRAIEDLERISTTDARPIQSGEG